MLVKQLDNTAIGKVIHAPWWVGYGMAVGGTVGVGLLIIHLRFDLGGPPVIVFLFPIIFSAFLAGMGPGITATGIATVWSAYLLLDPHFQYAISRPIDRTRWVALVLIGTVLSITLESLRRSRRRLELSEAELRESQRAFSMLISNLPGMAYRCRNDQDWTMEFVSEGGRALTGFKPSDLVGNSKLSYAQLIHPGDQEQVWLQVQAAIDQKKSFQIVYRIRTASGEAKWVWEQGQAVLSSDGDVIALEGFIIDITERKEAEKRLQDKVVLQEQLRRSDQRLRDLIANIPDVTWTADENGRMVFVSPNIERVLGYTQEEVYAASEDIWFKTIDPQDLSRIQEAYRSLFTKGEQFDIEYRNRKKDGTWIWIRDRAVTAYEKDGVMYADGILTDITATKQTGEAIRSTLEMLETVIECSPAGILVTDPNGNIELWNQAAKHPLGWSREEVSGREFPGLEADQRSKYQEMRQRIFDGVTISNVELLGIRKDGSDINLLMNAAPLHDAEGRITGTVTLFTDMTEEKRLHQQFVQAQKMEAVGLLAGGVAHDFNNLLGVILGYSDMLLKSTSPSSKDHKRLEAIKRSAEHGTTLTRQLLAFSRKSVQQMSVLDLNNIVRGVEPLLVRLVGEHIKLIENLQMPIGKVRADSGQLEQVLMNLVVNARDAMSQGGTLTIETRNVALDDKYARTHRPVEPGRYVMLALSDTGAGMSEEVQRHIFEPFFTTKEQGKGTGLGLAMVYGVVKQSGGYIWVYSESGKGSTFKIYLPIADAQEERVAGGKLNEEIPRGTESVLVVEDAEAMREIACEFLEGNGYRVMKAADGAEALHLLRQQEGPVHLLLTDVIMPGMSGSELAERAQSGQPGMKILYMSGYTDDAISRHGLLKPGVTLVEKPFTREELLQRVYEALHSKRG